MLYSRLPASRKMRLMSSTRGLTTTRSERAEPGAACPVTPLVDSAASRVERHNPAAVTMTTVNRCIDFRSEEHTSELRHLGTSYAVFCLQKKMSPDRSHVASSTSAFSNSPDPHLRPN